MATSINKIIIAFFMFVMGAAHADVFTELAKTENAKEKIRDAIHLRRPELVSGKTFRSYAAAIRNICDGTDINDEPLPVHSTIAGALEYLFGTKNAIRSAIIEVGGEVDDAAPFDSYASKIKAINCPGSLGFVDGNILKDANPSDPPDDLGAIRCENATVCDVLSNATSCITNTITALAQQNAACVGAAEPSDWVLMKQYTAAANGTTLAVGNVYRFDMRGGGTRDNVISWIYIPTHTSKLYSFQVTCNNDSLSPCVGITPRCPGTVANCGVEWRKICNDDEDGCPEGGGYTQDNIRTPNITREMIIAAQPQVSLSIYKLGP